MQADFLDAHRRHWDDAERLFKAERWANADHLYGMAAECGLKRLMLAFGMKSDHDKQRPVDEKDRRHANDIWTRYESYRCGHHQGANYALPQRNPFANWNVADRYAHQGHFDAVCVTGHQAGAGEVCRLVTRAVLEGLI